MGDLVKSELEKYPLVTYESEFRKGFWQYIIEKYELIMGVTFWEVGKDLFVSETEEKLWVVWCVINRIPR